MDCYPGGYLISIAYCFCFHFYKGCCWFFTFKTVDINANCFSTCTFKKVAVIHCSLICLIHFHKNFFYYKLSYRCI